MFWKMSPKCQVTSIVDANKIRPYMNSHLLLELTVAVCMHLYFMMKSF